MRKIMSQISKYKKYILLMILIATFYVFTLNMNYDMRSFISIFKNIEKIQIISIFAIFVSIVILLLKMKYKNKIINIKNIVIFLIPVLIFFTLFYAYYPGIITYDGNFQWQQVQSGVIETGHPFITTFFMLLLSKIYNSSSLIIFYQIFLFSIIWTYFCNRIGNSKKDFIIQIIYIIILCSIPIISIYAITLWKDIIYSYYLMGLSVIIYIGTKKDFKYNKFEYFILFILLFMIFNYRYNGIIVVILFILFMLIYKRKNKDFIKKIGILSLALIMGIFLLNKCENFYLEHHKKENSQKSLSTSNGYIFWMYGAHLNDGNIKEKDLKFLKKIADINEWKQNYNPFLINNTHMIYKDVEYVEKNDTKFKELFIKTSIKNPQTIIMHYLKCDALLWSPIDIGYVYIYDFSKWDKPFGFDGKIMSRIPQIEKGYTKFINFTYNEPIHTMFHRPANLMYFSIILSIIIVIIEKNKKIYLVLLPMILNTISLLPINLAQDLRYVYINYLTFGMILLLFITCIYKKRSNKKWKKY